MKKTTIILIIMAFVGFAQVIAAQELVNNTPIELSETVSTPAVPASDFTLCFIAFLGIATHILLKYIKAYQKKDNFDWMFYGLRALAGIIVCSVLVYTRDYFDVYQINPFTAFLLGYSWDSIFKNITGLNLKKSKAK